MHSACLLRVQDCACACWDHLVRRELLLHVRLVSRRQGVARYGVGRWREILTARELEGRFDPVRTGVDLKVSMWRCELMPMSAARRHHSTAAP